MKFSEDVTLDTLSQNLRCSTSIEEHFNGKILGLDEAFDVLEEQDVQHAKTHQNQVENDIINRKSFTKEFIARRETVAERKKKVVVVKCEQCSIF